MKSNFFWMVVLVMAALVPAVPAFSGAGSGTSADPYQITTYAQMNEIRNGSSSYYILTSDINCLGEPAWEPISRKTAGEINFQLDGNGYRISHLFVSGNYGDAYKTGAGFIGYGQNNIDKTIFVNVTFYNASVTNTFSGEANAGVLVGRLDGAYGAYNHDRMLADRVLIYNSSVVTPVTGATGFTGEFAGSFYGGYIDCAGYNNTVPNSSLYRNGGIAGFGGGDNAYSLATNVWTNSAGVKLFGTSTFAGSINSSYWNTDAGIAGYGGTGRNTTEMKNASSYAGWNFTSVWKMSQPDGEFGGYPVFQWTYDPVPVAPVARFTGTPVNGTAPLNTTFMDISNNTPTEWNWSFGDGVSANETMQNPVHTYTSPGNYTVSLNATNAFGSNTSIVADYIRVFPSPKPVVTMDTVC